MERRSAIDIEDDPTSFPRRAQNQLPSVRRYAEDIDHWQITRLPEIGAVFPDTVKERRGSLDAAEKDFTGRAEHGLFTFDVGNLPRRRAAVERREPQAATYHRLSGDATTT